MTRHVIIRSGLRAPFALMALAAVASVFYGIDWLFTGIATAFEVGEALDVAGLGLTTAYEFGEGELALFSDFGVNSMELGKSIASGARTLSSYASDINTTIKAVDTAIDTTKSWLQKENTTTQK